MSNIPDPGLSIALLGLLSRPPALPTAFAPSDEQQDEGLLAFSAPVLPMPGSEDGTGGFAASLMNWMQMQTSVLMLQLAQLLGRPPGAPQPEGVQQAPAGARCAPGGARKGLQVCGPVDGIVSGRFGEARPGHRFGHGGTDIAAAAGSPISAVKAGKVTFAGWQQGYGLCVQVDHGNGLSTFYAHCSRLGVRAGQQVGTGDRIASVGSTGHSTGPHLHFELRRHGQRVDPSGFLAQAKPRERAA